MPTVAAILMSVALPCTSALSVTDQRMVPSSSTARRNDVPSQLLAAAEAIRAQAVIDHSYASVAVDEGSKRVILYRVGLRRGLNEESLHQYRLAATQERVGFTLRPAMLTASEATWIENEVGKLQEALTKSHISLTSWGQLAGPEGPVVIGYRGSRQFPSPTLHTLRRFGRSTVSTAYNAFRPIPVDRMADHSPFFGGAAARGAPGVDDGPSACTTGFSIENIHTYRDYATTAWHCLTRTPTGTKSYAAAGTSGGIYMGTDTSSFASDDVAFLDLTSANRSGSPIIWNGSHTADSSVLDVGGGDNEPPVPGSSVCLGGATSGVHCTNVRWSNSGRITYPLTNSFTRQTTTVHGYAAYSTDESVIVASGDSGGPVYRVSSGEAIAEGEVDALPSNGIVDCPSWIAGRRPGIDLNTVHCGDRVYVVDLHDLLANEPYLIVMHD